MSIKRVAIRYAEALVELAQEQGKLETVKEDMDLLHSLTRNRDFFNMLKSPVIQHSKKRNVVNALLEDKIDELTLRFVILLINKERAGVLPEIAEEFTDIYRIVKQISKVRIQSAEELDARSVETITRKLREAEVVMEHVEVEHSIDPELIGGFVLEFGDYIYDASVRYQLAGMKRDFSENLYKSKIIKR